MNQSYLTLYTNYLNVTFGYATATGLSNRLEVEVSHDQVTCFLVGEERSSKDLWKQVKATIREVESNNRVVIFDETVQEKPWIVDCLAL